MWHLTLSRSLSQDLLHVIPLWTDDPLRNLELIIRLEVDIEPTHLFFTLIVLERSGQELLHGL